jgi:hypothetical protein
VCINETGALVYPRTLEQKGERKGNTKEIKEKELNIFKIQLKGY